MDSCHEDSRSGKRIGQEIILEYHGADWPILGGSHSHRQVYIRGYYKPRTRAVIAIMNSCRFFRILRLAYWHGNLKGRVIPALWLSSQGNIEYWEKGKKKAPEILEECMEQIRHGMRVDECKARR